MRHLVIGLLTLCLLASTCLASGSTSWGMFSEEDFRPQIGDRDIRVIVAALQLSPEETQVVRDLHAAHIGRVRDEGAAVKAACVDLIEQAQMLGDGSSMKGVLAKRDEWSKRREALDKEFLDELRLVLTAEQESRWSIVERELRRMRSMPSGRMLGESIDAIAFVTDDVSAPSAEVQAVLDRYAREIDSALKARDDAVAEADKAGLESLFTTDPEQVRKIFDHVRSARIRVRDLNRKAVEETAARLDPDAGAAMRRRLLDTMTQTLSLTDSFALQMLTAAADLESLSDSQRAQVKSATDTYLAKRDAWIAGYLRTAMEIEETAIPEQLARALSGEAPDEGSYNMTESKSERTKLEPLRRAWEERIEFEKRTREQVTAMLTPEQRTQMPLLITQIMIRFGDLYGTDDTNP